MAARVERNQPASLRRRLARSAARILILLLASLAALVVWAYLTMVRMPGLSYRGPFAPLSPYEQGVEADLRRHVAALAEGVADRAADARLAAAGSYVVQALGEAGYPVNRQRFEVGGSPRENLEAELPGLGMPGVVVIGAHYDTVSYSPGADDNGSGVASLLALARAFSGRHLPRRLRFVAFANEEPPYFQTSDMGSVVYAKHCRERREDIRAMLSLETLGYFSNEPGSQHYPPVFGLIYPTTGNFIAFVADRTSHALVQRTVGTFRRTTNFPSEAVSAPANLPGIGWSDQWAFWQEGYPAVMVTDTAPFRYPHYHEPTDTPDKLSYAPLARVVVGLERVIEDLASAP